MNRREFLQTGSGVVSGMLLLNPRTAFGYEANSAVRHGLLGCGNRGTSVATSFAQNTSARVVALADLFPDNLAAGQDHFDKLNASLGQPAIDSKLLFHGPHAFEQLAASNDVDLIQISTPPFFHVQHLEAAVASGKHVYCEKPVGIDVAQAKQALEIAKRVKPQSERRCGFPVPQRAADRGLAGKVKAGALGKIATASGNYNAPASTEKKREGEGPDEYRLRNWLWDRALSGDILVEQNIHIIDLCNWMLGAHPLKATATGGRNILTHFGDCWDNYQVDFTYPERCALLVCFHSVWLGWRLRCWFEVVRRKRIGDLSLCRADRNYRRKCVDVAGIGIRQPPDPDNSRPMARSRQSEFRRSR